MMLFRHDPNRCRQDFPLLQKKIIYFDNACMSLKPLQVIQKIQEYYTNYPACAGRSSHRLAEQVENEVRMARHEVKEFINASSDNEIIFTRNTTEGINLVANGLNLKQGDEVILSDKEHNSNLIPWLRLQKERGIIIHFCASKSDNTFDLDAFQKMVTEKTKLVSMVHSSNVDGVTNPVKDITRIAHRKGALVMIDAAQSAPHKEIDVRNLDVDFMAFSGHKMLGPTGTGVLYGKMKCLEQLSQFIVGGETVLNSTQEGYIPEKIPNRFEAGLQDYAGIIGLAEALRYLKRIGLRKIEEHEIHLNRIVTEGLALNPKVRGIGPKDPKLRGGIYSFIIEGMDVHHIARILDKTNTIMVRSGAHCAHAWFNKHAMKGSVRASFYLYNTEEEAKAFVDAVNAISRL